MNYRLSETELEQLNTVQEVFTGDSVVGKEKITRNSPDAWEKIKFSGLLSLFISREYGGRAESMPGLLAFLQETAKHDPEAADMLAIHTMLVYCAVMQYGSASLIQNYKQELISGEIRGTVAYCDPIVSDSVVEAKPVEGGYIINGTMENIPYLDLAQVILLFAFTEKRRGSQGITAFLVKKDRDTMNIHESAATDGFSKETGSSTRIQDLFVSEEEVLGQYNKGMDLIREIRINEHLAAAAIKLGIAEKTWTSGVETSSSRSRYSRNMKRDDHNMAYLIRIKAEIDSAKCLLWRAAQAKQDNEPYGVLSMEAHLCADGLVKRYTQNRKNWVRSVERPEKRGVFDRHFQNAREVVCGRGSEAELYHEIASLLRVV